MERPRYDVFLSYNHQDRKDVEHLARELHAAGIETFLDKSLEPGESWIDVLEQALETSAACVVCVGASGLGNWQGAEVNHAIDRAVSSRDGFTLISVLLPGSDYPNLRPFLRQWQYVDLRGGIQDSPELRKLIQRLRVPKPDNQNGGNGQGISRHQRTIPITHLTDNLSNLKRFISNRVFTPVLGSGCSLVGRSTSPAWVHIAEEMEHLLASLENDEPSIRYLRALAALPAYDIPLYAHRPSILPTQPPASLVGLQLALVRLGAALNELFASAMLESSTPVWDTMSFRLPIQAEHPRLHAVSQLLIDASIASRRLCIETKVHDTNSGLGAPGMYDHLIELTAALANDESLTELGTRALQENTDELFAEVSADIATARRRSHFDDHFRGRGVVLAVHQLEWIADALWHTFRYDKAAYPRSDELAFQVSLLAHRATGRGPGLPSVAQAAEVELSAGRITAWFRHYSGNSSTRLLEFYDTLARILEVEFKSFRAHLSSDSGTANKPLWPVVFSTNYDMEMESALQRASDLTAFHVVIPVEGYRPDGADPDPGWLFGTLRRHDDIESPEWQWLKADKHLTPRTIKGPMLLKLHGSPLHNLPNPRDLMEEVEDMPHYERFEHALVLTESQYMENIAWKDPLPNFFNDVLHQDRALFFLGHSVKEWSTRLRIFNHIYRNGQRPHAFPGLVAINRSHDPLRSALLSAIGIERWVGDLEELPKAVAAMSLS